MMAGDEATNTSTATETADAGGAATGGGKIKRRFRVWPRVALLAGAYVFLCGYMFLFQSSFVYFPSREFEITPQDVRLPFEDVWLTTEDGVRIHGWYLPVEGSPATLLICHGNAGNISHRMHKLLYFHQMGYSTLIYDYRGYGKSEGRPSEPGTYRDATAAWKFLVEEKKVPTDRIVLYGDSLGGAVAIELASRHLPRALIADCTFTSVVDVGARVYWWIPVRLLASIRYDSMSRIGQITCPKLFIHSPEDDLVPYDLARRLYEAAPAPKQFLDSSGDHNSAGMAYSNVTVGAVETFLNGIFRPVNVGDSAG